VTQSQVTEPGSIADNLSKRISKLICLISEEKNLFHAKPIGETLMELKVLSLTATQALTSAPKEESMNPSLQIEMYDNENRNLRTERDQLRTIIGNLE
jgi:hypothetical protein